MTKCDVSLHPVSIELELLKLRLLMNDLRKRGHIEPPMATCVEPFEAAGRSDPTPQVPVHKRIDIDAPQPASSASASPSSRGSALKRQSSSISFTSGNRSNGLRRQSTTSRLFGNPNSSPSELKRASTASRLFAKSASPKILPRLRPSSEFQKREQMM